MHNALLGTKRVITLGLARAVAAVAEREILRNQFAMFVAVVDDAGTPMHAERINDAQPASYEVAVRKAQAAVRFRRPTKAFEDRVLGGRVNLLSLPGIVAVEGGVPLIVNGELIGAIGVSGGTGVEDGLVAGAAAASLPEIIGTAPGSN